MREIPKDILYPFLKKAEGVKLKAYLDSNGVPTIGVGHTDGVSMGQVISAAEVDNFLDGDIETAHELVERRVKDTSKLSEHQYAALISFVFNLGANPSWTIWKKINAGLLDEVPGQLRRFVFDGGQRVEGLVNRRNAEVLLWNEEDTKTAMAEIDSQLVKETPSSGTLRDSPTPPAVAPETKPLLKQGGVQAGIGAAILGAPSVVTKVSDAIQPYAKHSDYVQNVLGWCATGSAVLVVLGLAFIAWRQYRARH